MILEANNITKRFGGLVAVDDVTFSVREREIFGIIGPNGAGKTTLFNVITGFYKPDKGRIIFQGSDITGKKPNEIAKMGLLRTWQIVRPFLGMKVIDNLLVPMYVKKGIIGGITEREAIERANEILEFVGLSHRRDFLAEALPQGERKRLEIARALASEPKLLMLDEPAGGLTPTEMDEVMDVVRKLRESGITVVVIEHNMRVVMGICERIMALNFGRKIAEGTPEEIGRNEEVIKAYLGERFHVGG
ncbi:MAG: ABC transporter ATP-binding protein [Candidatus Korarchaeum sp.]|jgi:branched-chain amino acid transport system ATP-binding protein|nr:ABC transporter ATP-binding protein [Candidatus Korarchaeum sp.]